MENMLCMPQSHSANDTSRLAIMGKILAYSWATINLILMVWNVNFIIFTDCEGS